MTISDDITRAEARFEAAQQRHDALRGFDPAPEETLEQRIAYAARMIALNADMVDWEDWRLNPEPERLRAECRRAVAVWSRDLNELLAQFNGG